MDLKLVTNYRVENEPALYGIKRICQEHELNASTQISFWISPRILGWTGGYNEAQNIDEKKDQRFHLPRILSKREFESVRETAFDLQHITNLTH